MEFFLGTASILILIIMGVCAYFLYQIKSRESKVSEKITYLGGMSKFSPDEDCTTVIPMPLHAATCDHDWEVTVDETMEMDHQIKKIIIMSCTKCGIIDKTVQTTDKAPPKDKEPCQHDWKTIKDEKLDMPHEQKTILIMTCKKCGEVHESNVTTSKMPDRPAPRSECLHKWIDEKKVTMDSAYEQMLKSISSSSSYGRKKVDPEKKLEFDYNNAPAWMFRKSYLVQRVCQKCGEVHAIIASNFDLDGPVSSVDAADGSELLKINAAG